MYIYTYIKACIYMWIDVYTYMYVFMSTYIYILAGATRRCPGHYLKIIQCTVRAKVAR